MAVGDFDSVGLTNEICNFRVVYCMSELMPISLNI